MGDLEIRELLAELRSALATGRGYAQKADAASQVVERLEAEVERLIAECQGLRARLERPPLGGSGPVMPGGQQQERVEAWVRRLERPETTAQ